MAVLKEGSKAPAFKAVDQNGKTISLADFKGKKVILYFYPKDDTPGCTAQACNLKENYNELIDKGFQVVGVSTDSVASHKNLNRNLNCLFHWYLMKTRRLLTNTIFGAKKIHGSYLYGHYPYYISD